MPDITTNTGVLTSLAAQQGGVDIVLDHITKQYPGQQRPAVEDFSMRVEPGELIMFVGPSGCGKTTTMKMINRIIEPTSGSIRINGDDVLSLDGNELRRHIGYVIQQIGLFPHFTIAENIAIVPKLLGWSKARIAERVDELLRTVQLDPGTFAQRYPRQLSGGQQQRVGVARALAADPPVMLMDEPFGATDPITREKLQAEFLRIQADIGKTIIFVTHDFEEAIRMGDRIAVLSDRSQIEQFDTPARILAEPANDYVRSFIGEGAALKRLALIPVTDARIGSADAAAPAVTVDEHSSLREALDTLVLTGAARVNVTRAGAVVGSIDQAAISAALGSEGPARRAEEA
ncbi:MULTISPECIES: ABC transporter ATP-binding protein [Microbacterium]|uniref:ATP-binding cassette domain-containing protein n=2 Tax=Microbacterium TaxID=33882 RepID=A0ABQ6V4R0_9MICO|nr:glycine/betaine ABC transporter [Microbacterium sp. Y-01]AZS45621.1 Osmoprotectant import ATP-binding protein OsmV [Microbacterium oxydans]KAB1862715.1 ATP-binding cassette domain-containing protein [Microbacterium algeriense]MCI1019719.1 ATP-binding cassette domain-containing protein [Microbacterium sp. C5A9]